MNQATNREIDRKIAELMGYNTLYLRRFEDEGLLPHYTTDWNAMRLLVEWLQGKGLRVVTNFYPDGFCSCSICRELKNLKSWYVLVEEKGEPSAPIALCKAILSLPPEVLS